MIFPHFLAGKSTCLPWRYPPGITTLSSCLANETTKVEAKCWFYLFLKANFLGNICVVIMKCLVCGDLTSTEICQKVL